MHYNSVTFYDNWIILLALSVEKWYNVPLYVKVGVKGEICERSKLHNDDSYYRNNLSIVRGAFDDTILCDIHSVRT